MLTIKSDRYTIYYRSARELKLAQTVTRMQQSRARDQVGSKERVAGWFVANLPKTHGLVMAKLNPDWLDDDWPRLRRALDGLIPIDFHQLRPGEVFMRPMVTGHAGSERPMTAEELYGDVEPMGEEEYQRAMSAVRLGRQRQAYRKVQEQAQFQRYLRTKSDRASSAPTTVYMGGG